MVSGADRPNVAIPAAAHTRNSSHRPNAGGTLIERPRRCQERICVSIGTAMMKTDSSARPNAHQTGYPASKAASGQAGWLANHCLRRLIWWLPRGALSACLLANVVLGRGVVVVMTPSPPGLAGARARRR